MKLFQPFKGFFLSSLIALYVSGVVVYVLSNWWQEDRGFGPEASPWRLTVLQMHSVVGLFFMFLFGYLWATHVVPAWRRRRKRSTGSLMVATCVLLFATVPFIFYATHEGLKEASVGLHTYLGLAAILPYILHMTTNPK